MVVGMSQPPLHVPDGLDESLRPRPGAVIGSGHARDNSQTVEGLIGRLAVKLQDVGQQHRVGQAVGDVVLPAQGVGHRVDVAHIGLGKGAARQEGRPQHVGPGLHVAGRRRRRSPGWRRSASPPPPRPGGYPGVVDRPIYASTAWVRASRPVVAVMCRGSCRVTSGSAPRSGGSGGSR